VVNIEFGAS